MNELKIFMIKYHIIRTRMRYTGTLAILKSKILVRNGP